MSKRTYTKRRRAVAEAETRRRITEAAVALHESVGPALATVSEIAKHAGVTRPTVYKHFPNDAALLMACSATWDAGHPGPDPARWRRLADPEERLRVALQDLYRYYADNERMLANVLRDRELVPALDALHREGMDPWLDEMADVLAADWAAQGRRRRQLRALVRLMVDFFTWRRWAAEGLCPRAAADLAATVVRSAT